MILWAKQRYSLIRTRWPERRTWPYEENMSLLDSNQMAETKAMILWRRWIISWSEPHGRNEEHGMEQRRKIFDSNRVAEPKRKAFSLPSHLLAEQGLLAAPFFSSPLLRCVWPYRERIDEQRWGVNLRSWWSVCTRVFVWQWNGAWRMKRMGSGNEVSVCDDQPRRNERRVAIYIGGQREAQRRARRARSADRGSVGAVISSFLVLQFLYSFNRLISRVPS
jgi:hypothetical protein